ncbi:sn-glycerol-3-phosphate ABC transporter ATP-binding protein UgpC [Phyllobacterium endophyticum]|uniref:sn-glycerol-3-phosphate ABC transporter ATP-binding protein UgpC n=1 Tax=Phyllobacterium endophyticum TaxID=1149773 RepID=A0A2P7ANN5_9HYPH|nr:sn-glycerol-3-phosphate ABC transporter ATP-binding protein UgpC [Phyllobacterium endophyticum]MBB3233861.1 sn-glycerol 3-phosphate transport system ATP-binding protein [Phyllobacterium endophyticum]PSH55816.1 sn-glycerol-3-phosphate ABC transporter ATP-binding protein UgpC [Phyllobacterium endophyticum]TXR47721.1 sn-glycerol-3-phosphate ABC transporter ATP-binding protein UgpC [Phyllobacterium endophyticum]TYR43659.1 sn-glycerol-3-phosphate ABC transporter ATP-binding protein UgpC [Phylloba
MANVELTNVRKVYGSSVEAVKGINIAIDDGALCVLVGPSGCGKSTLLRMIAGLESITDGTVKIDNKLVNDLGPAERDIAMVFQNYALYPHMKVYDNMAYGLRNRGMPKDQIDKRVKDAAQILELTQLLERRPKELSGGQRQRVAMGRAIVRSPKVFLFDEPLSNLDAKLRGQMRVEIKNLQRQLGVTSVYVTHDQLEAMTLADILVVMNAGSVEQIGAPLDIYEKPASTFVASFIGAPPMNLVPVTADGSGLVLGDGTRIGAEGLVIPGNGALIGFRPEDLEVSAGTDTHAGGLALDLKVLGVEPVGAESYVYGMVGGERVVVRVPGRSTSQTEDHLRVIIPADKLHLFGTDGKRISSE